MVVEQRAAEGQASPHVLERVVAHETDITDGAFDQPLLPAVGRGERADSRLQPRDLVRLTLQHPVEHLVHLDRPLRLVAAASGAERREDERQRPDAQGDEDEQAEGFGGEGHRSSGSLKRATDLRLSRGARVYNQRPRGRTNHASDIDRMRLAYFDCIAGISGDSALGALLDAGVDLDVLRSYLATLPLEPFDLEIEETDEHGIRAIRVGVRTAGTTGVIRTYASVRALLDGSDLPPEALRLAHRIFRRYAEAEARVHRREVEAVRFHDLAGLDAIIDVTGTALGLTMLGVERVFAS